MKLNSSRRDSRPRLSSRAKPSSLLSTLSHMAGVSLAILREIFDESAYERFLAQHQIRSTAAAYAEFCRDHECIKARRPRCC